MTLRCGIIGLGRIAWRYDLGRWDGVRSVSHASCIARHQETTLVAVLDPNADARKSFATDGPSENVAICDDADTFFAQGLDLVTIASPSEHHPAHIKSCFDARIPYLFVEKPVTLELAEFDQLLSDHRDGPFQPRVTVNFFRRFLPQFWHFKEHMQTVKGSGFLHVNYSRRLDVNGVHLLDIIGFLFDKQIPPELEWCDNSDPNNPDLGLNINRISVVITGQDLPYHALDARFTDARGRLSIIQGGRALTWEAREDNPDYPGFYHLAPPIQPSVDFDPAATMRDGTYLAFCNLVDDSVPSLAPLASAYFSQSLMERAFS